MRVFREIADLLRQSRIATKHRSSSQQRAQAPNLQPTTSRRRPLPDCPPYSLAPMRVAAARAPPQASQGHTLAAASPRQASTRAHPHLPRPAGSRGAARWRTAVLGPLKQLWGEKPAAEEPEPAVEPASSAAAISTALPAQDDGADEALAATDAWAAPLPGDADDVAELRQLLAGTRLETAPLVAAYDADRDGWSADAFHTRVDRRGPALVVALTGARARLACERAGGWTGGTLCRLGGSSAMRPHSLAASLPCAAEGALLGGYNPAGWTGEGREAVDRLGAFLFVWPTGDTSQRPIKLPKARPASAWEGCSGAGAETHCGGAEGRLAAAAQGPGSGTCPATCPATRSCLPVTRRCPTTSPAAAGGRWRARCGQGRRGRRHLLWRPGKPVHSTAHGIAHSIAAG